MLTEGKLPANYVRLTDVLRDHFASKRDNYETSYHEWMDEIEDPEVRGALDKLRRAPEILESLSKAYEGRKLVPVPAADEVYVAVDPSKMKGSDIALTNCHYDGPFKFAPDCGNKFIRVLLSVTENNSVYTTILDETSMLSTLEWNAMDYNEDYHCVRGQIPPGQIRVLLKIHFMVQNPTSPEWCLQASKFMNERWAFASRFVMRNTANPQTAFAKFFAAIINFFTATYLTANENPATSGIILLLVLAVIVAIAYGAKSES